MYHIVFCPKCGFITYRTPEEEGASKCLCGEQFVFTDLECTKELFDRKNPDFYEFSKKFYEDVVKPYGKLDTEAIGYSTHYDEYFNTTAELYCSRQKASSAASLAKLSNVPRCPICKSTDLSKITLAHKAGKIAAFGIFGMGDNGKTWKCNNCGSRF